MNTYLHAWAREPLLTWMMDNFNLSTYFNELLGSNDNYLWEHICQQPPLLMPQTTNQCKNQAQCLHDSVEEHGFLNTWIICHVINHKLWIYILVFKLGYTHQTQLVS